VVTATAMEETASISCETTNSVILVYQLKGVKAE